MKHTKTPLHRLADIGRKLAFFIFVLALGSAYLWNFQPKAINFVDKRFVKLYKHQYKKLYRSAKTMAAIDGEEGLTPAIKLAGRLSDTKIMDRLAPIKRKNFELIASTYEQSGNYTQALHWLNQWIAFDDKDLLAKVRHAEAMLNIPEKYNKGMEALGNLYQRVPEGEFIAEAYIRVLFSEKKYVEAFKISRNYKSKNHTSFQRHWQVYWDLGDGFTDELMVIAMPKVDKDGLSHITFNLPPDVKRVRLDPPPLARYKIVMPRLHFIDENLDLWKQQLNVNDVMLTRNGIITTGGGDPYFHWEMPQSYLPEHKISFTARIGLPPLSGLENLLLGPSSNEIEASITKTGDKGLIKEFNTAMQEAKISQTELEHKLSLSIYWSKNKEAFSEKRRSAADTKLNGGEFEVKLPIAGHIEKLRVDFPGTNNATYIIKELRIIRKKTFENIDVKNLDLILKHDIYVKNGAFLVTGGDPHFAIKTTPAYVESILIRGIVK